MSSSHHEEETVEDQPATDTTPATETPTTESDPPAEAEEPTPPVDPATIALPSPDSDEKAFHTNTLLEVEDRKAAVSLPSSLSSKYLWTPSSSDVAHPQSKASFQVPHSLSLEASSIFREALSLDVQAGSVSKPRETTKKVYMGAEYTYDPDEPSDSSDSASVATLTSRLSLKRPMSSEPFVTLFCPYDHTTEILDAVVEDVAQREGLDVVVLDLLEFARGRDGAFGEEGETFLKCLYDISNDIDSEYSKRRVMRFLHAFVNMQASPSSEKSSSSQPPRPRLIYVKEFGSMTKMVDPILRALIKLTRLRRMHPLAPGTAYGTFVDPSRTADSTKDSDSDEDNDSSEDEDKEDADMKTKTPEPPYTDADEAADLARLQSTVIVLGISASLDRAPKTSHPDCPPCIAAKDNEANKERQQYKYKQKSIPPCTQCTRLHFGDAIRDFNQNALQGILPEVQEWDKTGANGRDVVSFVTNLFVDPSMEVSIDSSYYSDDTRLSKENVYRRVLSVYDLPGGSSASSSGGKRAGTLQGNDVWDLNDTPTQTARIHEMETLCLAANERVLLRQINETGNKVALGGDSLFASLPISSPQPAGKAGRKSSKASSQPDADDLLRKAGLLTSVISSNTASRIATFARELAISSAKESDAASSNPRLVPSSPVEIQPAHVIEAFRATISRESQVDDWLGKSAKKQQELDTTSTDKLVHNLRKGTTLSVHERELIQNVIDRTQLKTSFKDVCLDPHIIDHVRTTISFPLKYPRAFSTGLLGTEAMSGILLYGPPGTGKTMLCRAVAKECNARMLIIQPSHVKDMWQGESEKLVRSIFTLARKIAPCIVFIDEVDAIFGSRTTSASSSTTHRSMLTEFMTEMDGLNSGAMNKKKGLVVIGATNRPFDLDDAILRRLPLRLLVDLPGLKERERIFRSLLKDENVDGIDVESLAKKTPNFSGSDIKNLTVSAALASLKDMIHTVQLQQQQRSPDSGYGSDSKDEDDEDDEAREDEDEDDDLEENIPPRVIRPEHFKAAFEQVTATVSQDMDSVRRLRRWAEQFSGRRSS